MKKDDIFIISRRAYEQDDIEYGTYEPIFITTKEHLARKTFRELQTGLLRGNNVDSYTIEDNFFEYQKNNWCYQIKLVGFVQDKLTVQPKT